MTRTLWRLIKQQHAAAAFSGEGAARYGGRWNPIGLLVVYLSETLSLAVLELLVHLTMDDRRLHFAAIPVRVPAGLQIDTLELSALPAHWRDESIPEETQRLGAEWAARSHRVLLRVPSVIIPSEHNYLADPQHADIARLVIGRAQSFSLDPWLAR